MFTQYRIYGMERYTTVIDDSLLQHELHSYAMVIRLILTEALHNAYKHGNKSDDTRPIDVTVLSKRESQGKYVRISVADTGSGFDIKHIPRELPEDLLMESGRGLFLIRQFAEAVTVDKNHLNISVRFEEEE